MKNFIALLLSLLGVGCVSLGPSTDTLRQALVDGGAPACPTDAATCVPIAPPLDVDAGCDDGRWVALAHDVGAECPPVVGGTGGRWLESKLFEQPGGPWTVPPALRGFCVYEWSSAGGAPPDVTRLTQLDALVEGRSRDCRAVAPMAPPSAAVDAGWLELRAQFHAQAGRLAPLPLGNPLPVRVAVIDTAPTDMTAGAAPDDRAGHGEAVAQLINELGCPDGGACPVRVVTSLALPRFGRGRIDLMNGGRYGFISESAVAIHRAVARWRVHNAGGVDVQPRMVLNLSIGWAEDFGGDGPVGDLPMPVRAVYLALEHARCQGVVTLAAAGNDSGGTPRERGPLFPARWETRRAPDFARCQQVEGSAYAPNGPFAKLAPPIAGDYQPLVFGVSGLRADNSDLGNARLEARARLAAPGGHAVAMTGRGGATSVLTGTSASTALVSGIVGAVWGYVPEYPASELMKRIWDEAAPLGATADFCEGSPCEGSKRPSLCASLAALCDGGSPRCPSVMPPCESVSTTLPRLRESSLQVVIAQASVHDAGSAYSMPAPAACETREFIFSQASYPRTTCPARQYPSPGKAPWVGPQPGSNPCPVCTLNVVDDQLLLSIDPSFKDFSLKAPTLTLDGEKTIRFELDALHGGDVVVLEKLELGTDTVKQATLSFEVEENGESFSTQSELIITQ